MRSFGWLVRMDCKALPSSNRLQRMLRSAPQASHAARGAGRSAQKTLPTSRTENTLSMPFSTLGLSDKVLSAVESAGFNEPTPIQAQAIPHVLERKDVLGLAQTGTGKDRRLLASHPHPTGARQGAGKDAAFAGDRTDTRTGSAGRRKLRDLRGQPQIHHGAAYRRGIVRRAGKEADQGRRYPDRDTRPVARPFRARQASF